MSSNKNQNQGKGVIALTESWGSRVLGRDLSQSVQGPLLNGNGSQMTPETILTNLNKIPLNSVDKHRPVKNNLTEGFVCGVYAGKDSNFLVLTHPSLMIEQAVNPGIPIMESADTINGAIEAYARKAFHEEGINIYQLAPIITGDGTIDTGDGESILGIKFMGDDIQLVFMNRCTFAGGVWTPAPVTVIHYPQDYEAFDTLNEIVKDNLAKGRGVVAEMPDGSFMHNTMLQHDMTLGEIAAAAGVLSMDHTKEKVGV